MISLLLIVDISSYNLKNLKNKNSKKKFVKNCKK